MATTTFDGPVRSKKGFTAVGTDAVVEITTATTLTYKNHVGRIIEINDADGAVTLPSIKPSEIGAEYVFYIGTAATDLDIKTDGTDKFVGNLYVMGSSAGKAFAPAAANDVISMNGSTRGGGASSWLRIVAVDTAKYLVQGSLIGSGTTVTPFANA